MPVSGNIRKFSFDLSLSDDKIFEPLGNELLSLAKNKLIQILEDVFQKHSEEENIVIEKIEIDVGDINLNNLESVAERFNEELLKLFKKNSYLAKLNKDGKEEEAVLFFIQKGHFPWWISDKAAFNLVFLGLSDSFQFSDPLISRILSDKAIFFRLVNTLGFETKQILIRKLLSTDYFFFEATITFFKHLLLNYSFLKSTSDAFIIREIEYYFISKSGSYELRNSKGLFFDVLKYFSTFLSIPFTTFLKFISQDVNHSKIDHIIKELVTNKSNLSNLALKASSANPLALLIAFLENGMSKVAFNTFDEYKHLLELLLKNEKKTLLKYFRSISFFESTIKVERLAFISSDIVFDQLITILSSREIKLLAKDLKVLFSDKIFTQNLSVYNRSNFSSHYFRKVLLVQLIKGTNKKTNPFNFINQFVTDYIEEGSMTRNDILFEFYRIGEKRSFKAISERIFEALFSSLSTEGLSASKTNTPEIQKPKSEIVQMNAVQLAQMQKDEITSQLTDLFNQLPASKNILEKFVYQTSFSKVLDLQLLKGLFKKLESILKINLIKLIDDVIQTIALEKKNQYRFAVHRISFQIIVSKGKSISSVKFLEELIDILIRSFSDIFKVNKAKISKTGGEDYLIQKIIDKVNERSESYNTVYNKNETIERFNVLLRLKQDILDNTQKNFIGVEVFPVYNSFDEITSSTEALLDFLRLHFQDYEMIMAFSEISIEEKPSKVLKNLIGKVYSQIFNFEENLLNIQKQFNIITLAFNSFKVILRTFLLKKIGALGNLKQFSESKFIIDFFESLKRENYINFQQLTLYLNSKLSKKEEKILLESLSIFNAGSKFTITNQKIKNALFYKDLVFYYLKSNKIPAWANIENFDTNDVILFLKVIINQEDRPYLVKLISDVEIISHLPSLVIELPYKERMKLLELIQLRGSNFNLALVLESLNVLFEDVSLTTGNTNENHLIFNVFTEGLWKQSSLISFIEKLYPFVKKSSNKTKTKILTFLAVEFNIPEKLILLKKSATLSEEEQIEVLKFFLETNTIPKHLTIFKNKIEVQIKNLLLEQDFILMRILKEYAYKPQGLERLFSFIHFNEILNAIQKNILGEQPLLRILGEGFQEFARSIKISNESKTTLIVNLILSFENRVSEIAIKDFFRNLKLQNTETYKSLLSIVKERVEIIEEEDLQSQKDFFNEIESSQTESVIENKVSFEPIDILDYYLEIGSINYENRALTKSELFEQLERSIKESELLIKRMLHIWTRSDLKLNRLMDLIPPNKRFFLANIIHPELVQVMDLFVSSMKQLFDKPTEKLLLLKNNKELELKILKYWLQKSIYLDSPFELIVLLFEELISNQKISSKTFFQDYINPKEELPLKINNFLLSLKRNYDNYKNQLSEELILKEEESKEVESNDTDSIVIQNAGLIILWPFFYRLFDKCGFLIDRQFKDEVSLQKSILMTQYLVTDSVDINENELVLNKILCGVPQNTIIDVKIELDEMELDFCDSLLKGVLQNWEKLSNSSVASLRETFLIREGILSPNELDYKLDIFKGTFDMLIDTIPWNISIIQTTFMKNRITVNWK